MEASTSSQHKPSTPIEWARVVLAVGCGYDSRVDASVGKVADFHVGGYCLTWAIGADGMGNVSKAYNDDKENTK
jgi:hypothetical protein